MKEKPENKAIKNAQAAIARKVYVPKRSRRKGVRVAAIDGRLTLTRRNKQN